MLTVHKNICLAERQTALPKPYGLAARGERPENGNEGRRPCFWLSQELVSLFAAIGSHIFAYAFESSAVVRKFMKCSSTFVQEYILELTSRGLGIRRGRLTKKQKDVRPNAGK